MTGSRSATSPRPRRSASGPASRAGGGRRAGRSLRLPAPTQTAFTRASNAGMGSPMARKTKNRRGSEEAVAKRRAARALNKLFEDLTRRRLDGRTEKRRRRLLAELKSGRRGRALKPSDFVAHVSELLALGESIRSLRKNGLMVPPFRATPEALEVAREVQELCGYDPRAWKLLGVDLEGADRA